MKVKFWGVRGSIAAPGANTLRFGGNTSCYEIISRNGTRVILDAGTGIRELGLMLGQSGSAEVHLLISHTHWDHIQGFPFFVPAFVPGNALNMYGPIQYSKDLAAIIRMQMDYEVFPVREAELRSDISYHNLGEGTIEIDDLKITTKYTNHPVMTLSYRVDDGENVVVYSGDTEPYFNVFQGSGLQPLRLDTDELREIEEEVQIQNRRHVEFCRDADLLIHDAQYTEEEYLASRRGWGHSPVEHALNVGLEANVRILALSHHDPTRSDEQLLVLEKTLKAVAHERAPHMRLFFAAEQMELEL